jgi:hypothetical protein
MKVAGIGADALFKMLGEMLEGKTELSDKDLAAVCAGLYADFAKDYSPFLRMAPGLAGPVSKDLTPIVVALFQMFANILKSAELKKASKDYAKAKAELRKISMEAYVAAGFTRQQAFQLVLHDAAQPLGSLSMIQKSLNSE